MTPFMRVVRNTWERLFSKYYEGPSAPKRLAALVDYFMKTNPHATRADWAEFAKGFAEEAYRTGYVRGYEWCERDLGAKATTAQVENFDAEHNGTWIGEHLVGEMDGGDLDAIVFEDNTHQAVDAEVVQMEDAFRRSNDGYAGKRHTR
jgi:hypothetical protein